MTTNQPSTAWAGRMIDQTERAESVIEAGDTFAPHDGQATDLNYLAADLLADPDDAYDFTRDDYDRQAQR